MPDCFDEKNANIHSQHFYAMIRHGERADNINAEERKRLGIEVEDLNDAPLTPLGFQQAQDQATFLKTFLQQRGYSNIVIEASPFLRTMQTASIFAKELGLQKIKLNCLLAKWMRVKSRTQEEEEEDFNPFNHLVVAKFEECCKNYFTERFMNGIEFYNVFPEHDIKITDTVEYNFVRDRFPE